MNTDKHYLASNPTDFTSKKVWYQRIYRLFNLYPTRVDIKIKVHRVWNTSIIWTEKDEIIK